MWRAAALQIACDIGHAEVISGSRGFRRAGATARGARRGACRSARRLCALAGGGVDERVASRRRRRRSRGRLRSRRRRGILRGGPGHREVRRAAGRERALCERAAPRDRTRSSASDGLQGRSEGCSSNGPHVWGHQDCALRYSGARVQEGGYRRGPLDGAVRVACGRTEDTCQRPSARDCTFCALGRPRCWGPGHRLPRLGFRHRLTGPRRHARSGAWPLQRRTPHRQVRREG
mmetsp:Transcript_60426/g.197777  ORF Transcript_60426/g.197777 Transcript_60426/m.197777 type:complete len:233 (-) Transcript_60426:72-770(-)